MKILLVEDIEEKAEQVRRTIFGALGADHAQIDVARSFIAATRHLERVAYDLLLLDIVLPIRDGEQPASDGGKKVLTEIASGLTCRRPSHIICLTEFEERAELLEEDENRALVHIVIYREADSGWREALTTKARYVQARLLEAEVRPREFQTDIAIITSSPLVELNAVRRLPGEFVCEYSQSDALDYYSTGWKRSDGRSLSIVACSAPRMGMTAAAVTACKVIERWRPKFLAMTGIAAGTRKKNANYGDVIVADSCFDYGSGKIEENDKGERIFIPSPTPLRIGPDEGAVLQRWEQGQLRMDEVRRAFDPPFPAVPRLNVGVIATGAAVVQNQSIVDDILSNQRKVLGLDMEAYAIFEAAHLMSGPRPRVLVAKAVSDFATMRKNDKWQRYAAFTSARFVFEFFTNAVELDLGST